MPTSQSAYAYHTAQQRHVQVPISQPSSHANVCYNVHSRPQNMLNPAAAAAQPPSLLMTIGRMAIPSTQQQHQGCSTAPSEAVMSGPRGFAAAGTGACPLQYVVIAGPASGACAPAAARCRAAATADHSRSSRRNGNRKRLHVSHHDSDKFDEEYSCNKYTAAAAAVEHA